MEVNSLSTASNTTSPPPYSAVNTGVKLPQSPSTLSTHEKGEKPPSRFKKFKNTVKTKVKNGFDKITSALSPSSRKSQTVSPAPILTPASTPIKPPPLVVDPPASPSVITPVKITAAPKPVQTPPPAENEGFYAWLEKWMMTIISKFDNLRSALWKFIQAIFGQESN